MAKITLAAGKAVEPFWHLFPFHFEQAQVAELLKGMRVGTLDAADVAATQAAAAEAKKNDPFGNDPVRHPGLKIHSTHPCNAEVPAALLTESYLTPTDLWYIRHHHPVPDLKGQEAAFRLSVDALAAGGKVLSLSLAQLRALPQHEVLVTLQCSGNRRGDMNKVKKCSGTSWGQGAISTALWKGPRLADVVALAGVAGPDAANKAGALHVCFKGLDAMAASVPVGKALGERGDVILALDMNGLPLVREHGAPLRAIVPGHVGVRNVKWVGEVKLSPDEAVGDWQRGLNYKVLPPGVDSAAGIDVASLPAMQEASVFSGITGVEDAGDGKVDAKGWAWSGGGRGVARVDVSADGGNTWRAARITEGTDQAPGKEWAWVFWECDEVPAAAISGKGGKAHVEVVSRAVDKAYNFQPENAKHIWNTRGLANNSWFRVQATIDAAEK